MKRRPVKAILVKCSRCGQELYTTGKRVWQVPFIKTLAISNWEIIRGLRLDKENVVCYNCIRDEDVD